MTLPSMQDTIQELQHRQEFLSSAQPPCLSTEGKHGRIDISMFEVVSVTGTWTHRLGPRAFRFTGFICVELVELSDW